MRDITIGETFDVKFTTAAPDTGAPATLSGTPVVSAYVGNSVTQITAGITLSVDFDGVTGLNNVRVVATTGNGYTDGSDVSLVITTGTVSGNSAVGYVIENFTIGRSAANTAAKPLARAAYLVDTTIATLASQTSFTLTAGSADDNAYIGQAFIFTDATTATQKGVAFCSAYTGSTRTVTLEAGPDFTIATTDLVTVVPAGGSTSTPVPADVRQWIGTAVATPTTAGVPEVDVTHWNAVALGTTNPLPNAAPGASGGLVRVGSNSAAISFTAGMTISNSGGNALSLSSSGGNGHGLAAAGNGSGDGINAIGGGTGHGAQLIGGITSGDGLHAHGVGTGHGIFAEAHGTGAGISAAITGNITGNLSGTIGSLAAQAKADVNAEVDTAVANLVSGIITGAAATGTLSTTQATSNLTGYADDQLIGRVIIWLTGACEGEASDITDYANASGLLTFTALTTAPSNGDTFKIV